MVWGSLGDWGLTALRAYVWFWRFGSNSGAVGASTWLLKVERSPSALSPTLFFKEGSPTKIDKPEKQSGTNLF